LERDRLDKGRRKKELKSGENDGCISKAVAKERQYL
jgi:hypothetical protein